MDRADPYEIATLIADTAITVVILTVLIKKKTGWKASLAQRSIQGCRVSLIVVVMDQVTDRLITRLVKITFGELQFCHLRLHWIDLDEQLRMIAPDR